MNMIRSSRMFRALTGWIPWVKVSDNSPLEKKAS